MAELIPGGLDATSGQYRYAKSGDVFVDDSGDLALAGGVEILSITAGVDATSTGVTNLYTVPSGIQVIITHVAYRVTAAASVTVAPDIGVGIAAGEDDIIFPEALTGISAVGDVFISVNDGKSVFGDSSDAIDMGIDVAATATTLTLEVNLIGFIVGAESAGTVGSGGFFTDGAGTNAAIGKGDVAPTAAGTNSVAQGDASAATANNSFALGNTATATNGFAGNGFSLGTTVAVSGAQSFGLGSSQTVSSANSFALGSYSTCSGGQYQFSLGNTANCSSGINFALGYSATASGYTSFAMGNVTEATAASSFAFGDGAVASATYSFAFGKTADATVVNSFAFGYSAQATGTGGYCFAFGNSANATGSPSFAFGSSAVASGDFSVAIGNSVNAAGDRSFAVGQNGTSAPNDDQKAFGSNRTTNPSNPTQSSHFIKHVQTTNSTPIAVWSITTTTDKTYSIQVNGAARNTATTAESAAYYIGIPALVYNDAGTAIISAGSPLTLSEVTVGAGPPSWSADLSTSGAALEIVVTGDGSDTVEWIFDIWIVEVAG